jgi:hypothetical protein
MVDKSDEFIKSIFWTDEFTVQSWPNGEIVFDWAPKDSEQRTDLVSARIQNGGVRVMFWASMTWHSYGPLIAVEGSQNQTTYKQLLMEQVLPEFAASNVDLVFQHDNAPCHTARSIKAFLEERNMQCLNWPPQSPDLSPIEWMWNVIKMKLKAMNPRPRTKEAIIEAVYFIWTNLDPEIGKKVCMTFRKRMQECINKNGHLTGF